MAMLRFVFSLHVLVLMKLAYAAQVSKLFEIKEGLEDNGQGVLWSFKTPSKIACVAQCLRKTGCLAVVYRDDIQTCSFLNSTDSLIETYHDGFSYILVREKCVEGWVEFNGSRYLFGNQTFEWSDALGFCNMHGATLVEIETPAENVFIQTSLRTLCDDDNQEHWIGLNFQAVDVTWIWASGTPATYIDWGYAQPNGDGYCAAIWASFSYQWVDEACTQLFYPICERGGRYMAWASGTLATYIDWGHAKPDGDGNCAAIWD